MKQSITTRVETSCLIMVTGAFLMGCATVSTPRNPKFEEKILILDDSASILKNVKLKMDEGSYRLTGTVTHRQRASMNSPHVDVAVIDSAGETVLERSVPVAADRVRGRYRPANFEVVLRSGSWGHPVKGRYRSGRISHTTWNKTG